MLRSVYNSEPGSKKNYSVAEEMTHEQYINHINKQQSYTNYLFPLFFASCLGPSIFKETGLDETISKNFPNIFSSGKTIFTQNSNNQSISFAEYAETIKNTFNSFFTSEEWFGEDGKFSFMKKMANDVVDSSINLSEKSVNYISDNKEMLALATAFGLSFASINYLSRYYTKNHPYVRSTIAFVASVAILSGSVYATSNFSVSPEDTLQKVTEIGAKILVAKLAFNMLAPLANKIISSFEGPISSPNPRKI